MSKHRPYPSNERKIHYKMYKHGKQWLFAAIFTAVLGGGWGELVHPQAATETALITEEHGQNQQPEPPTNYTVDPEPDNNADQTTEHDQQPTAATDAGAQADTTAEEQPAPPPKTDSANKPTAGGETTTVETQPAPAPAADATDGRVTVDKDNFLDYFHLSGGAEYDQDEGIVTLTPDEKHRSGNATLENKIDNEQSFTMSGAINLGNKSQPKGADGISFGFHTGRTDSIGHDGGGLGFAGLPDAFGWKADTFWDENGNGDDKGYFDHDPNRFRDRFDPDDWTHLSDDRDDGFGEGVAFGAFIHTEYVKGKHKVITHEGKLPNADAAKQINVPDGKFHPITIDYDAATHKMTVSYDGKKWAEDVSEYASGQPFAFFIAAATGEGINRQQFKIDKFTYTATGVVQVHFVDDTKHGEEIQPRDQLVGPVNTVNPDAGKFLGRKIESIIWGGAYIYKNITTTAATLYDQDTGELTFTTAPGDIYVHFNKVPNETVTHAAVSKTVHYLDEGHNRLAPDFQTSVEFTIHTDRDGNVIAEPASGTLGFQASPEFSGYSILPHDAAATTEQSVSYDSADIEVAVIYHKDAQTNTVTRTIEYVDQNGQRLAENYQNVTTIVREFDPDGAGIRDSFTEDTPRPQNPNIPGYHIVRDAADYDQPVRWGDADSSYTVIYAPLPPEVTQQQVQQIVAYVDSDGQFLRSEDVATVTFTRTFAPSTNNEIWTQNHDSYVHQQNPHIKGYHIVEDGVPTGDGLLAQHDDTDSYYEVVYERDAPIIVSQYTATKTVHYLDKYGKQLAPDFTVPVTFFMKLDVASGEILYSQTMPYYDGQANPVVPHYQVLISPPEATSRQNARRGNTDQEYTVIYVKDAPIVISQYTATKTVHYVDHMDREKRLADDFISKVTFTKLKDPVTGEISYQQTAPVFGHQELPEIKGYWMSSGVVDGATTDQPARYGSTNQEYWVLYAKEQDVFISRYTATKTIHYRNEQGETVAPDFVFEVTFERFQDPATDEYHDYATPSIFGHQDYPHAKGYHVLFSPPEAINDQKAQYGDTDQEYTVIYGKDDPIITEKTIYHTIHYVNQYGHQVGPDHVHAIHITRITDPVDDTYRDVATETSAPRPKNPVVPAHRLVIDVADDHAHISFEDEDQEYAVIYMPITDTISKIVHYRDDSGKTLAPDYSSVVIIEPFYNQSTGTTEYRIITSNQQLGGQPNPTIPGYTVSVDSAAATSSQAVHYGDHDSEYTVVYRQSATETGQTPPPVSGTPDTPDEPDKPTPPEEPVPDDGTPPTAPNEPEPTPNAADIPMPAATAQAPQQLLADTNAPASTVNGTKKSSTAKAAEITRNRLGNRALPQTGNAEADGIVAAGIVILLGILGMAGLYRRQH